MNANYNPMDEIIDSEHSGSTLGSSNESLGETIHSSDTWSVVDESHNSDTWIVDDECSTKSDCEDEDSKSVDVSVVIWAVLLNRVTFPTLK